jgi:serine/threonine protein kinase
MEEEQMTGASSLVSGIRTSPEGPAADLEGKELRGGWKVLQRLDREFGSTGGLYSVGYLVEHTDGTQAFMKAHDYARAVRENVSDFSRILEDMLGAHNFERDINDHCADVRMSRVVRVLAADGILVDGSELPVNYLIFELAEGDVRHRLGDFDNSDLNWKLKTCHQTATGLSQLHRRGIAHQDLKPSNLMDFGSDGSKIGDLGNAWRDGRTSPLSRSDFAGDPEYAPPECLYSYEMPEIEARLKARDLYMFGSILLFLLSGADATCALLTQLPIRHRPGATGASFEQALPHLYEATDKVAEELERMLADPFSVELGATYRQLCDPDPLRRGHPLARTKHSDPYSLDRYISQLDRLAKLASGKIPSRT